MRMIDLSPFSGFAAADLPDTGAVPMMQWLALADLRIDPSYQRDVLRSGQASILKIARAFCWAKFTPVIVAAVEGGLYAIIDGQHRATAAALRGIEKVPCYVVIADRRQQAYAFAAINGQVTKLHAMSIYHARLAAGDPEVCAVQEACDTAGVTVMRFNVQANNLKRGETLASASLIQAYRDYGRDTLVTALQCVTETADGNPGLLCKPAIDALCIVLWGTPTWREAGGALLDAMDDFDFRENFTEAKVAHTRQGGTITSHLTRRLRDYLTQKLGGAHADA